MFEGGLLGMVGGCRVGCSLRVVVFDVVAIRVIAVCNHCLAFSLG